MGERGYREDRKNLEKGARKQVKEAKTGETEVERDHGKEIDEKCESSDASWNPVLLLISFITAL